MSVNLTNNVPLRDEPLHVFSESDKFAQLVLDRLRERDELTARRLGHGLLSPKEIARIAGEVHVEIISNEQEPRR